MSGKGGQQPKKEDPKKDEEETDAIKAEKEEWRKRFENNVTSYKMSMGKVGGVNPKNADIVRLKMEAEAQVAADEIKAFEVANSGTKVWKAINSIKGRNIDQFDPSKFADLTQTEKEAVDKVLEDLSDMWFKTNAITKEVWQAVKYFRASKGPDSLDVDWSKFSSQLSSLVSSLQAMDVSKTLKESMTELNPFETMVQICANNGFDAFGVCMVYCFASKDLRTEIGVKMLKVDVFLNRVKKLNRHLVSLMGYICGMLCNDIPLAARMNKLISNPLLGFTPADRKLLKRDGETDDKFKARKETHDQQFKDYVSTLEGMKRYTPEVSKLETWKTSIRAAGQKWIA